MLSNLSYFFVYSIFAAVVFHLIPTKNNALIKKICILAFSLLILAAYAPLAGMLVLCLALIAVFATKVFELYHTPISLAAMIFAILAPLSATRLFLPDMGSILTLGVAFATVRSVALVYEAYARDLRFKVLDVLVYLFFFPLYTVGPMEFFEEFRSKLENSRVDLEKIVVAIKLSMLGVFFGLFVADTLLLNYLNSTGGLGGEKIHNLKGLEIWAFSLARFLYSYINFLAFSHIAVAMSALFGMHVMANFRAPLLAANIQDFWKRYHISMGNFINRYIYFPIVVGFRYKYAPAFSVFIAFILFGMWHEYSLQYLVWGLAHGTLMATYIIIRINRPKMFRTGNVAFDLPFQVLSTVSTILFVATVQTFANMKDIETSLLLISKMFGAN